MMTLKCFGIYIGVDARAFYVLNFNLNWLEA